MSKLTTDDQIKAAMLAGITAATVQLRSIGRDYRYSKNPVEQAAYVFAYDKTVGRSGSSVVCQEQ